MTRNGRYRFPVPAIGFMLVSFAGVILAIHWGSRIAFRVESRMYALEPSLLQPFLLIFALVFTVAVVIWALLFVSRRSGTHRLAEARTWPAK